MIANFDAILNELKKETRKTIAVSWGHHEEVLLALKKAQDEGIAKTIIYGDSKRAAKLLTKLKMKPQLNILVEASDENQASQQAAAAVGSGEADVLMKGLCSTSSLLRAILNKENNLRGRGVLSHIGIFEVQTYHKLIILSDPAMIIAPDLKDKISIVKNAVHAARCLGIIKPKVAIIAAIEKVNPGNMPATEDAAILTIMNKRGQLEDCIIDGPLALDLAFSREACEIKGFQTEVGGDTDIAIMPNIEAGNIFYKSLTLFAPSRTAGLVMGANAPVVLTSRADSEDSKFLSIALALKISSGWGG